MANIEFPDQVIDAFIEFMEENPVLWSNDNKYAFQRKQKKGWPGREIGFSPEGKLFSDPDDFTRKWKIISNLFF